MTATKLARKPEPVHKPDVEPEVEVAPDTEAVWNAWAAKYGRSVLIGLCVLVGLTVVWVQMSTRASAEAEGEYLAAAVSMDRLVSSQGEDLDALVELDQVLDLHSELGPQYEGRIAQVLLAGELKEQGVTYGNQALLRNERLNSVPSFHQYSKVSLLMAEGKWELALKETEALQQKLASVDTEDEALLQGFNLLRLGILQKKLGRETSASESFERLRLRLVKATDPEALGEESFQVVAYQRMLTHFQLGRVSLIDFLASQS